MPGVAKLDPDKYLGEIKGINIAAPVATTAGSCTRPTATSASSASSTRAKTRSSRRSASGQDPWRIYMSHDGKYAHHRRTTATRPSRSSTRSTNSVAATLEAGPDMTGVNFAAGKAFVISSTSGFVYVYDMTSLKPAGRIKIGTNVQLETATTDTADEKLYLAESTNHAVVIIDAQDAAIERVTNVGLFRGARTSWTARTTTATDQAAIRRPPAAPCWPCRSASTHRTCACSALHSRAVALVCADRARARASAITPARPATGDDRHRGAGRRAHADADRRSRPPDPDLGPHGRRHRRRAEDRDRVAVRRTRPRWSRSGQRVRAFPPSRVRRCTRRSVTRVDARRRRRRRSRRR